LIPIKTILRKLVTQKRENSFGAVVTISLPFPLFRTGLHTAWVLGTLGDRDIKGTAIVRLCCCGAQENGNGNF
jgi:hypothetical protein